MLISLEVSQGGGQNFTDILGELKFTVFTHDVLEDLTEFIDFQLR
jgi:hypothetical protein